MPQSFRRIALFARQHRTNEGVIETLNSLYELLKAQQYDVFLEAESGEHFNDISIPQARLDEFSGDKDLMIVVGGDGSLLSAARRAIDYQLPLLGINRGRLGFLTDIPPDDMETQVNNILAGDYIVEQRFLLETQLPSQSSVGANALNDVVLQTGGSPHMIEFELFIDDRFVYRQRADGLIIATPTGSTAYALSGGGPILQPSLDAIAIVPMFPHRLTSRPIVIDACHNIRVSLCASNDTAAQISYDGHDRIPLEPGESFEVRKKSEHLRLLHPLDYDYYQTLRVKLGWQSR